MMRSLYYFAESDSSAKKRPSGNMPAGRQFSEAFRGSVAIDDSLQCQGQDQQLKELALVVHLYLCSMTWVQNSHFHNDKNTHYLAKRTQLKKCVQLYTNHITNKDCSQEISMKFVTCKHKHSPFFCASSHKMALYI